MPIEGREERGLPLDHEDLKKAWAEGESIQIWDASFREWVDTVYPCWLVNTQYRVKPVNT